MRAVWVVAGCLACGLGFAGMFLPVLPATVFFILAAFCFSKGSPRLLNWVLRLPTIGPLVKDYRDGLGMPRAAKVSAVLVMLLFAGLSFLLLQNLWMRIALAGLVAVATAVIWRIVPTREQVVARARCESEFRGASGSGLSGPASPRSRRRVR